MALNWYWSEHLGTVERIDKTTGKVFYTDLYKGNALLIEIYTNPETEAYYPYNFCVDDQHAKNCLKNGLKLYDHTRVRLIDKAIEEHYKPAQIKKLFDYLLRSGAILELI